VDELTLTERELAAAVALVVDPRGPVLQRPDARPALDGLTRAELLDERGALREEAAPIVRAVARPLVRVELRVSDAQEAVQERRAWGDEAVAVTGRLDGDAVHLTRHDRDALPRELVRLAGLRTTQRAEGRRPLRLHTAVLTGARERLRAGEGAAALEGLRTAGLEGAQVGAALALADGLQGAFVASGSWREPDGEWHTGVVAGLDGGTAGWWSWDPGAADAALEPTDAQTLGSRLVRLLP
jgi:hypothetical protein